VVYDRTAEDGAEQVREEVPQTVTEGEDATEKKAKKKRQRR
jgi:hypothetical protein